METTITNIFKHRHLKDVRIFLREASFYLGKLTTEIRIRVYQTPDKPGMVCFEQSHHIQTPLQGGQ